MVSLMATMRQSLIVLAKLCIFLGTAIAHLSNIILHRVLCLVLIFKISTYLSALHQENKCSKPMRLTRTPPAVILSLPLYRKSPLRGELEKGQPWCGSTSISICSNAANTYFILMIVDNVQRRWSRIR